jgi:hypothetical protein
MILILRINLRKDSGVEDKYIESMIHYDPDIEDNYKESMIGNGYEFKDNRFKSMRIINEDNAEISR